MQTTRLLISTLAAAGIVGLAGLAVAQSSTTTVPSATTTTTVTPPSITSTTETDAQRMDRERMDRERLERARMNAPAGQGGMNASSGDSPTRSTARRDADGNLYARADRN